MDPTPYTVLIVDRDVTLQQALESVLTPLGYRVLATRDPDSAYALLDVEPVEAVLLEARLQTMPGLALYLAIIHRWPHLDGRVAVMMADADAEDVRRWTEHNHCTVFLKSLHLQGIVDWLERARKVRIRRTAG